MSEELKDVTTRGALVAVAVGVLVVAILIGIAVFGGGLVSQNPDKDKYQAVFLANGQVYFGKLSGLNGTYANLNDVYYIQTNPQQASTPSPSPQPNLSLVQLGDELHGPEREMQISRTQIVFWENLKDDSKVVKAIEEQKNQKK